MASLVEKLFETMPLTGVFHHLSPTGWPIGGIAGRIRCTVDPIGYMYDPPKPSQDAVDDAHDGDTLSIWGWKNDPGSPCVEDITCRVRGDDFKQFVVLDRLDFGCAPASDPMGFTYAVRVQRGGREFELPLEQRFRLMTFTTGGGRIVAGKSPLFPLESMHDPSFVHVFAYDIAPITGELMALRDDGHPEADAIDTMLLNCLALNDLTADDPRNALEVLFADDLWHPSPIPAADAVIDPLTAVAVGVGLGGLAAVVGDAVQSVGVRPTRVLVALCFTACKERDDYVPGHLMPFLGVVGMARLYPQILTAATDPLEKVHSAIRFMRPARTTVRDGHQCGCGEMLTDIGTGLWTDNNAGNALGESLAGPPLPFWCNIFNYYAVDPDADPALTGRRIRMVRSDLGYREQTDAAIISRELGPVDGAFVLAHPERSGRVTKVPRQAEFDNIHLAPRMRVRAKIDWAMIGSRRTLFTRPEDWKMDRVVMAPFCAHDCFHMHTRWSAIVGAETHVNGWNATGPYAESQAPMVPTNHDVDLVITGPASFVYADTATDAPASVWQVACYHGAGYGVKVGAAVESANLTTEVFNDDMFVDENNNRAMGWALFYWRLRYYFVQNPDNPNIFEVRERVAIHQPSVVRDL